MPLVRHKRTGKLHEPYRFCSAQGQDGFKINLEPGEGVVEEFDVFLEKRNVWTDMRSAFLDGRLIFTNAAFFDEAPLVK